MSSSIQFESTLANVLHDNIIFHLDGFPHFIVFLLRGGTTTPPWRMWVSVGLSNPLDLLVYIPSIIWYPVTVKESFCPWV